MESNTPNYARWIPEAGGYVHNGTVVSKNPVYGEDGRTQIEVDITKLQTPKTPGTQENQAGSDTDVNANATQLGSLGSLANNTAKPEFGSVSSPATTSNVAGQTVLSPLDQINKDYEYMVATGNLKGQIDKLTQISQMTGVDYSNTINDLWNQRSQKIKSEDSAYAQAIAEARQSGNEPLAQELTLKQQMYRDSVGYFDQMGRDFVNQKDTLQIDYETTYMQGISDITNGIMSQLNNLINFQYNPQMDLNLQVAQGYAVGAVKEQMNHTGMYYSSMTQSAIARAVAELVPVYEKMAREEIKDNISLLQNVGNYLMNLENMQLSIWEAQLTMKFKANAERRAEINQAIENANARGYYTNEEAILLGVPAGTESYEARTRAENKQDEIEKELRTLQIQQVMADYNKNIQKELMREEYNLKAQYSNGSSGSSGKATIKTTDDDGNEITTTMDYDEALARGLIKGTEAQAQSANNGNSYVDKDGNVILSNYSKAVQDAINSLKDSDGAYSSDTIKSYILSNKFKNLPADDRDNIIHILQNDYYKNKIGELALNFSDDYSKTTSAVNQAYKDILEFANLTRATGESRAYEADIKDLYDTLFTAIDGADKFDYVLGDLGNENTNKANSKIFAKSDVITAMEKDKDNSILNDLSQMPEYKQIRTDADNAYKTATLVGQVTENVKGFFSNMFGTVGGLFTPNKAQESSAQKDTNALTENTTAGTKSDKKIYVTITPPDSSEYSIEEFAKRIGFEYDSKKGKPYYYEGAYPEIQSIYKKYVK